MSPAFIQINMAHIHVHVSYLCTDTAIVKIFQCYMQLIASYHTNHYLHTQQVIGSLTTALEETRRENDVLKTEITQLRTNSDAMKDEVIQQRDEIGRLNTLLDNMAVNTENQIQQINFQNSEIAQLKTENQQLKVSEWSGVT